MLGIIQTSTGIHIVNGYTYDGSSDVTIVVYMRLAGAWLILLSIATLVYQILATVHLYEPIDIKILYTKATIGNYIWYRLTIMVSMS